MPVTSAGRVDWSLGEAGGKALRAVRSGEDKAETYPSEVPGRGELVWNEETWVRFGECGWA